METVDKDFDIIRGVMHMEIITGYFISKDRAMEAAETLRNRGFKGEISVIGRHNDEDFSENKSGYADGISGEFNYENTGFPLGLAGMPAAAFMIQGSGPYAAPLPIMGLFSEDNYGELTRKFTRWGIPKKEGEEIRKVIDSGNSVILVKSEENEKQFISDTLQYKGAQNIHS